MTRVNIIDFIARKLKALVGIVQDTDTATVNIAKGKYVIWKGNPCKASSAISSGGTLSASNLTALTEGVGNDINSNIVNNTYVNSGLSATGCTIGDGGYVTIGKTIIVNIKFTITASYATISGFPAPQKAFGMAGYDGAQEKAWFGYMNTSGQLITPGAYGSTGTVYVSFVYCKA